MDQAKLNLFGEEAQDLDMVYEKTEECPDRGEGGLRPAFQRRLQGREMKRKKGRASRKKEKGNMMMTNLGGAHLGQRDGKEQGTSRTGGRFFYRQQEKKGPQNQKKRRLEQPPSTEKGIKLKRV